MRHAVCVRACVCVCVCPCVCVCVCVLSKHTATTVTQRCPLITLTTNTIIIKLITNIAAINARSMILMTKMR